jgi:flavin reductase (DIM6/NTAB) family NADH-FMN oxidoreductase RutF
MALDGQALRQVMRRWATGVSVVTAGSGAERHGITVNSFSSLSLDPPLCLICIDRRSRAFTLIPAAGTFTVNFLGAGQEDISGRFAGRRPDLADPFEGLELLAAPSGNPVIPGCLGYLDCALEATLPGGDHVIFIGRVQHAAALGDRAPLIFFGGAYRALAPS